MAAKKTTKKEEPRAVITLRVPPALHKRLRIAAAYNEMTIQDFVLNGAKLALGVGT
jgi:uncharacterized protein (DUF1778 family)